MSTTPTAASRIQAQQQAMQGKEVICSRCGSNFLRRVSVTTYRAGGYGTVSIQENTDAQPFDLLICVCGYPASPSPEVGRRAAGVREQGQKDFLASVKKAQTFLKEADPEAVKATLSESVAGKFVEGRVEDLTDRVNTLEAKHAKPAHEAQEKKAKPANDAASE